MNKKLLAVSLIAMLGLTSCSAADGKSTNDAAVSATEAATEEATTEEAAEEATTEEATTEEATEESTTTADEDSEDTTTSASDKDDDEDSSETAAAPVEGLSDKYADLDNRSFAYKGKIFTVGVSTFQDLLDGGVDFKENDAANKDNNVSPNHSTEWYTIDLSHYSHIQVQFTNVSDAPMSAKECPLQYVRWYTIYVPNFDDEERNADIKADLEEAAKVVQFAFPITLTSEELLANSPDYTEYKEGFNQYNYKTESSKYIRDTGYEFSFDKDTDQLKDMNITWLP